MAKSSRRFFMRQRKTKASQETNDGRKDDDSTLEFKADYDVVRVSKSETLKRCSCRPKERKLKRNFYYTVLKIHPLSSNADIDLAYQNELNAFQLLKGKQGGVLHEEQIEKLIEVNFAYKIIGDPKRRKIYDKHGLRGVLFVEKYGSARLVSFTANNSSCSNFCFMLFTCLTVCWCFFCCFGFCFGGCFCYCCCNHCCGKCTKNDKKHCTTHGLVISSDAYMPKGLQDSIRTVSKQQLKENREISSRLNDSASMKNPDQDDNTLSSRTNESIKIVSTPNEASSKNKKTTKKPNTKSPKISTKSERSTSRLKQGLRNFALAKRSNIRSTSSKASVRSV